MSVSSVTTPPVVIPPAGATAPAIALSTGATGATTPPVIALSTGVTGATASPTATTLPTPITEPVIPAPASDNKKMNDLMLWYAVSGYAYAAAYLKTVEDIEAYPDGNGVFNTITTNLIGILGTEELKKDLDFAKKIDEDDKDNIDAIKIILASMPLGEERTKLEAEFKKMFSELADPLKAVTPPPATTPV